MTWQRKPIRNWPVINAFCMLCMKNIDWGGRDFRGLRIPMNAMLKKWHRYIGFCPLFFCLPSVRQEAGRVFQILYRGTIYRPGQAIAAGLIVVLTVLFLCGSGELRAVTEEGEFRSLGHLLTLRGVIPTVWIPKRMWNGSGYCRLFLRPANRNAPVLAITPDYTVVLIAKKGMKQIELQKNYYG